MSDGGLVHPATRPTSLGARDLGEARALQHRGHLALRVPDQDIPALANADAGLQRVAVMTLAHSPPFDPCPILDYTPSKADEDAYLITADLLEEAGCHDGARKWRLIAREHADGVAR